MALTSKQLTVGKRVRVEAFTANVTEDGQYDDDGNLQARTYKDQGTQVQVRDDRGNTHFVNLAQLEVEVPFKDGELYLSATGAFVFYVANADDPAKPGTWRIRQTDGSRGTVPRSFGYPSRPVTPVTFGKTITE